MGVRSLCAGLRGGLAAVRALWRQVGSQALVPAGGRVVHPGIGAVRAGTEHDDADRVARDSGAGRRDDGAAGHGDHPCDVSPRPEGAGLRAGRCGRQHGRGDRAAAGRGADHRRYPWTRLASDLPGQSSGRDLRDPCRAAMDTRPAAGSGHDHRLDRHGGVRACDRHDRPSGDRGCASGMALVVHRAASRCCADGGCLCPAAGRAGAGGGGRSFCPSPS